MRKFIRPIWGNDEKTQIIARLELENGGAPVDVSIVDTESGNPDWKIIMDEFGIEGIDANTEEEKAKFEEHKREKEDRKKENEERIKTEALFNYKVALYEIPEIQESTDRELKSKIRKAASVEAAQTYASVLVMKEMMKDGDEN